MKKRGKSKKIDRNQNVEFIFDASLRESWVDIAGWPRPQAILSLLTVVTTSFVLFEPPSTWGISTNQLMLEITIITRKENRRITMQRNLKKYVVKGGHDNQYILY